MIIKRLKIQNINEYVLDVYLYFYTDTYYTSSNIVLLKIIHIGEAEIIS